MEAQDYAKYAMPAIMAATGAINPLIPLGLTAAQMAIQAIPNAAERAGAKELRELKARQDAGELGLTSQERASLEAYTMNPVKTQQAQQRAQQERMFAASGQTSGGQLFRAQQAEADALGKAAQSAGEAISKADIAEKKSEEERIAQLTADKAAKQEAMKSTAMETIGQLGSPYGVAAGGEMSYLMEPESAIDVDALRAAGVNEEYIDAMVTLSKTAAGRAQLTQFGM